MSALFFCHEYRQFSILNTSLCDSLFLFVFFVLFFICIRSVSSFSSSECHGLAAIYDCGSFWEPLLVFYWDPL